MLFCPFLPGIGFFANVLFFYLRAFSIQVFNKPPKILSSSFYLYMNILLLTFFLCFIPVTFTMGELTPSLRCGPFRYYSMCAVDSCVCIYVCMPAYVHVYMCFVKEYFNSCILDNYCQCSHFFIFLFFI